MARTDLKQNSTGELCENLKRTKLRHQQNCIGELYSRTLEQERETKLRETKI